MDYLPKLATITQTCEWLHAKTGETWILQRLLECHLMPYFWLDYTPGNPVEIFGDRKEGFLACMVFAGDTQRLEADATDALVTMSRTHDGNLFKTEPAMRVALSELRFKRHQVERVATIINAAKKNQPVPESASNASEMEPPPVATGDVAYAFDGLRGWNEKAWKDSLGSPPKWLEACIAIRGQRGVREHHWNPVLIGAVLVHNGHAKSNSVRARFQTKPQLKCWLEAWKNYEADNFETQ